jgi:hypothetical protein
VAAVEQSRGHQAAHATDTDESESPWFHAVPPADFMHTIVTGCAAASIPAAGITD